jgi:hypothetical protein
MPQRRTARRALALLALFSLIVVVGTIGFQSWQTSYYQGLYMRDHTIPGMRQLYSPSMPGVDPTFLVSADSGRTYTPTRFLANEPLLTGGVSGEAQLALSPYTYRDAEVDLWMVQFAAGRADETGLVVRVDPTTGDMVRFGVNQLSQTWSLREHVHGGWRDLQAPTFSDAITPHTNLLLTVIMRGDEYALLINYHFVGVYHSGALGSGRVGLFTTGGAVTCRAEEISVFRNAS